MDTHRRGAIIGSGESGNDGMCGGEAVSVERVRAQIQRASADGRVEAGEAKAITSRAFVDEEGSLFGEPESVGAIASEAEVALVQALLARADSGATEVSAEARQLLEAFVAAGPDRDAQKLLAGAKRGVRYGALAGALPMIGPQGPLIGSVIGLGGMFGLFAGGALGGALLGMWQGMRGQID